MQKHDSPFIKTTNNTHNMMRHLLLALLIVVAFSFFKNGIIPFINEKVSIWGMFYPLIFIMIGPMVTFGIELGYAYLFLKKKSEQLKEYLKNSYGFFPGLFLALILPINTPIYVLIIGAIIATVFGKLIFGGFGSNIFNPALIGCFFVMLIYSSIIATNGGYLNALEVDTVGGATPSANIASVEGVGSYETLVSPYGDLSNFFFGTIPGAMGETGTFLIIFAFIYLLYFKVIKWEIPVIYIATVFGMTCLIGSINELDIWYPLFQVMSGGLLFGAVFMATDPVTSPVTPVGRILFGLFLGILTVAVRFLTPYPEGVMSSILTLNMFVFIFDKIGVRAGFKFNKAVPGFVIAWILIVGLSFYIGNSYKNVEIDVDHNFNIIAKDEQNGTTIYKVTQKGFGGNIKANIVIDNDKIKDIEILEINDSYYSRITKEKYIDKIIKGQSKIEEIDAISGATITSLALKKMALNTIKEYQNNK